MDDVKKLFSYVERKREEYNQFLEKERRSSMGSGEGSKRALDWISEKLRKAGALIEPLEAGPKSPRVLNAVLGKAREKKTILIYAHLHASCSGKELSLFGNGMVDAKGPLLCVFAALDAYRDLKIPVPVNMRFLIESMMEKDSDVFFGFLKKFSGTLFTGIDYVTVLDNRPNYFYGSRPLLCWGLRGCCKFEVQIDCAKRNLNSGDDSGAIQEATADMISLFSTLVNYKGDILIPGINSDIQPVSPVEEEEYHKATFDIVRYKSEIGASVLLHKEDKKRVLMHTTRFPSLSILGIRPKDDSTNGDVPASVIGTFCIRTVPNQSISSINDAVKDHIDRAMTSNKSSNKFTLTMPESSAPWEVSRRDPNVQACLRALRRSYEEEPELIREGGTIPVLNELYENTGKQVLLLPIGRANCRSPSKTDTIIFMDGTKTLSAYLYEASM